MSDATDDLDMEAYFGTKTPVRDMDTQWYTHTYKGVKYRFRSVDEANEWAKQRGFRLSTTPPTDEHRTSKQASLTEESEI